MKMTILSGYPIITGEFLFANKATYPNLSAHGTAGETVEIWGPDGAAFPTVEEVLAWKAALRTDVKVAAQKLAERRQTREELLFSPTAGLVAQCYAWLQRQCLAPGEQKLQSKSPGEALMAGQDLCAQYGGELRAWIDFGTPSFAKSMSQSDDSRPWLEWTPVDEEKTIRQAILDAIQAASHS